MTANLATHLLPVTTQLELTPEILRLLIDTLTKAEAVWKPAPQRFSIAEVMAHLCDAEEQAFRTRLQRMVDEDRPALASYDQEGIAAAGGYAGRDVHESFQRFRERRADNLAYLRSLPPEVAARGGQHPELGAITVEELLNEWAFHDLGHLRQIAELLRAYRYYPRLGAFRQYYAVAP
jgi:hypothetical protein